VKLNARSIAIALGVVICLLAAAFLLRGRLIAPRLIPLIQETLSRCLGVEVTIGHLGGSLLADIEIGDLQTPQPGLAGPLSVLAVKRLSIRYSAFALLEGLSGFIDGMRVEAEGLRVELDLDRGGPSASESRPALFLPAALPAVRVRDADVALRWGELRTRFDGITLNVEKDPAGARRVRLAVADWSWSHPLLAAERTTVAAQLALTPEWLAIQELSIGGGRVLAHGRLGLAGAAERVPFEAQLRFGAGRLSLAGDFDGSALNAGLKADQVELEPIAALLRLSFSGRLSTDLDLSVPFDRPEAASGRLTLAVLNAKIQGIELANASVAASAADGQVRVSALEAASSRSRLSVAEAAAPLRLLLDGAWGNLLQELSGRFELFSEDLPQLLKMTGLAVDPPRDRIPEHRLAIAGRFAGGDLRIPNASLTSGSNRILLLNLETRLPPAPADTPLKGDLRIDLPDLELLARIFPLVAFTGRLKAEATVGGSLGRPEADVTLAAENLTLENLSVGTVSLKARCAQQQILVRTLAIRRGADALSARGSIRLPAGHIEAAECSFAMADAEWLGPYLDALAPRWGRPSGRAAGTIQASGPLGQPDFNLDLYLERIQTDAGWLGDTRIQAQGTGREIRVERAEALTPAGRMQVAGRLTRNAAGTIFDATLENFSLSGEGWLLTLAPPARIRYEAPGRLSVERFEAAGPQGRMAVRGVLAFEGRSDLTVELTRVTGAGWLPKLAGMPLVLDGLEALLRVGGTAASPEVSLAGTVGRLGAEGQPLTLAGRFDLAYAGQRLRIEAFEWTGPDGHRLALTGALPIDPAGDRMLIPGALSLEAAASLPDQELLRRLVPAWPIASGIVGAELALQGTWAAPSGALRVNGRGLNPADGSGLVPPGPYEARVELAMEERRIVCTAFDVKSLHAQLQGAGVWQDYPAPARWAAGGPPREGALAVQGRLVSPDLGWLARGFKNIRRAAGRLDVDLRVEGPLSDPRLQADIRLADGELRPEADMPPLQALSLEAGFDGKDLTIRSLRGELGGAPFQVSGSVENMPAAGGLLRVDLRFTGENLLLIRSQALRARADADLRLSGPLEGLALSGTLALTDGLISKNLGLAEGLTAGSARPKAGPGIALFSIETPPLRDMRFDVRISAGRPIQIKNNLAKGALRPDLRLGGTGEAPELLGRVYLDATTLFLPAGRMQFDSGVIHFEAVDPGRPRLDMLGAARMVGYDITAVVEGPYDEPSVTLSSAPPLPDAELLALVLTGQPPKTPGSDSAEKRQGLNVAVFIGRDVLMRLPGGGTTESLQVVLERFDVDVGRSVTRAGDETINARFRVADGVLRPGDTLYLTGEKDVFDHYNAGVRIVFRFR
jgi:autotransporter translocation and assembly factor TamB